MTTEAGRQLHRGAVLLPGRLRIAEQPEGDDGHVDVPALEGAVHHGRMQAGVPRVEVDRLDRRAGSRQPFHGCVPAFRGSSREHNA